MRFWIDRHGCVKNQVDAEQIAARLEAAGHDYVEGPETAELIIVNTCGFIEEAKRESIQALLSLRSSWPDARLVAAGCLSQRYADTLAADMPELDGIVGNADLSALPAIAEAVMRGERPVSRETSRGASDHARRFRLFDFPGTAHLKITEGCSNNCSYCAIPLIRGPLRSRPMDELEAEARELVDRGILELVIVGQDLASYGKDLGGSALLPELAARLAKIPGACRFRLMYLHPDNFPEELLDIMASEPRLLPYLDIPFQHASEPVLRAMNRRGNAERYLRLIEKIRERLPDAALRSTFLVGFPGESDGDFETLLQFQKAARFDWLGSFAYSREEDTPAWSMKNRVPKKIARERARLVMETQEPITRAALSRFAGRTLDVLVEEVIDEGDAKKTRGADARARGPGDGDKSGLSIGRAWNQAPEVDGLTVLRGAFEPGFMLRARVLAVAGLDFDAAVIDDQGSGQ